MVFYSFLKKDNSIFFPLSEHTQIRLPLSSLKAKHTTLRSCTLAGLPRTVPHAVALVFGSWEHAQCPKCADSARRTSICALHTFGLIYVDHEMSRRNVHVQRGDLRNTCTIMAHADME